MKIAVSAMEKHPDCAADTRFGRCRWFLIGGGDEIQVVENKAVCAGGGAGVAAAQLMIDEKVDAVVTGNVGPNAHRVLAGAGIRVFKADDHSCAQLIELCRAGKLREISGPGPAHAGIGGRRG